jgi:hypothetical protein
VRTVNLSGATAALLLALLTIGVAPAEMASAAPDNPVPFITALSPSGGAVGGSAFTLTVEGSGFVPESEVRWNEASRPTTYLSAGQLSAEIDAADIATAATVFVTVFNPAPGGGVSRSMLFLVRQPNPAPAVMGLSPAQAMAGDEAFGLTVIGSGFVQGSTVLWNGEARATGFINEAMLTATVRAADVAAAGTAFVSVVSPAPGGGQSPSAGVFTIVNPAPSVSLLEPAFVWAGGPGFTLAVTGSRFTPASVVQWAGVDRPTLYVSPERLEASILAAEVMHAGAASVRVFTPAPGGGLSSSLFMDVRDDDVPPVTTVAGLGKTWHRSTKTFSLVATDVGLGVEHTFYRVGQSGDYSSGDKVTVNAPKDHSNDGLHTVQFFSIDKVLNWEFPVKQVSVGIDTRLPQTIVAGAQVKRNSDLYPRYRITDGTSSRAADAQLVITTWPGSGKVVLRRDLGQPLIGAWRTGAACRIRLPRGTYRMRVLAHDLAGNAQSVKTAGPLTVY